MGFAYEDIVKGPGHKFGYNYKNLLSWMVLGMTACPIVNLLVVYILIDVRLEKRLYNKQHEVFYRR